LNHALSRRAVSSLDQVRARLPLENVLEPVELASR